MTGADSGQDRASFFRKLFAPQSLHGKLLLSHISVASLGLLALMIAFVANNALKNTVAHLVSETSPKALTAATTMSGIQRSMAWLRLSLSDETYRMNRRKAWTEEIWPAMADLYALGGEDDHPKVSEIVAMLKALETAQWWVEDSVASEGNIPSHMTLTEEIQPVYSSMNALIDLALTETGRGQSGGDELGETLDNLKSEIQVSFFAMHDFVDSAEEWTERDISDRLANARAAVSSIPDIKNRKGLAEIIDLIKADFGAYDNLMNRALSERKADNWNLALFVMNKEVFPTARRVTQALSLMSARYSEEMKKDAQSAAFLSQFVTALVFTLILVMIAVAVAMSRRNAARITMPVAALSSAADAMADGKYTGDIPVASDDEVGRLTKVFNRMRSALEEKEASLKRRADELEKANKEMESFIYSVSHDLKVPMITIQGMAKLLEREIGDGMSKDSRTYFDYIFGASATMSDLLDDLLEMSRVGRMDVNPEIVDMNSLVKKVFAEAGAFSKNRGFAFETQSDLPGAYANNKRVYQLLSNLVSNAVKFMPASVGKPVIEIGWRPGAPAGFVEFFVRDNGAGIDPKYHEKIFTLFNRLHGKEIEGTGMGLAFVKKILENMGCAIHVESEPGKGAAFHFTLPKIPEGL